MEPEDVPTFHSELMLRGEEIIEDKDWCADAQRRVAEGSDGLWVRFGAKPGPDFAGQCFALRFNPCVSFFATALLFGLVGFCSTRPGFFCTESGESYEWTSASGASSGAAFPLSSNEAEAPGVPSKPGVNLSELNLTSGLSYAEFSYGLTRPDVSDVSTNCSQTSSGEVSSTYPCICGTAVCSYLEACTAASNTCDFANTDLEYFVTNFTEKWAATASWTSSHAMILEPSDLLYASSGIAVPISYSDGAYLIKEETVTLGGLAIDNVPVVYEYATVARIKDKECFMPKLEFDDWMAWVTECFTWLYIITQDIWIVFGVWLAFSRYGNLKLGRDHEVPEFSYFSWFALLFTCGVATGLFYFAVSEPQYYYLATHAFSGPDTEAQANSGYKERNRWTYTGVTVVDGKETMVFNTINDRVQNAMTTTWYHWGLHGWIVYSLIGVLLALLHFRKGLPMTIKTCFYPLMGARVYGFSGDLLDTVSVVATTMGVCTSLGLGVMQVNNGIEYLNGDKHWLGEPYYNKYNFENWKDTLGALEEVYKSWPDSLKTDYPWYKGGEVNVDTAAYVASIVKENDQQLLLIWVITATATLSVMLGLKYGIKQLAGICLALGQFVIFYVWMMDDTYFITNLFVQTLGHYVAQLPTLGFYASAVEQSEVNNAYGEYSTWQFWWTIFYWGWWIAWAPFVGVFLARISKGRTIREFIFATLFTSCLYNFLFLNILGGAGLKMQLLAEKYEIGTGEGGCNGILSTDLVTDADGNVLDYKIHPYKRNVCRPTSTRKYNGESEMFCSTITNLGCSLKNNGATRPLWNVVGQYSDAGRGLVILTLIALVLYFVASSDSGSMVDDMLTANGLPEPCLMQRFYWAMTEGAAASALLSVGKYIGTVEGGLKALRAASICVGLPYTFLCCLMCFSLLRAVQYETGELRWGSGFKSSILDVGITIYQCGSGMTRCFNGERGRLDLGRIAHLLKAFICPALPLLQIAGDKEERRGRPRGGASKIGVALVTVLYYAWFSLLFIDFVPVATAPVEWGSVLGNASAADGNSRYFTANRYGYFHQWSNQDDEREVGEEITRSTDFEEKASGVAVDAAGTPCTVTSCAEEYGVGDMLAKSRRISAIGWFLFFAFVVYITSLRNEVREIYKIVGSLTEDFFCCLLWPMALLQLREQLQEPVLAHLNDEEQKEEESI